ETRSSAAPAIQPAVRDSADPGRVTGRNWPQESVAVSIGEYIGAVVGNSCVTFFLARYSGSPKILLGFVGNSGAICIPALNRRASAGVQYRTKSQSPGAQKKG